MFNYDRVKALAREKRAAYGVSTETLNLNVVRKIYSAENIRIDNWKFGSTIRAVYMCDDGDFSVAVNENLPRIPKLFSLVHELKHHYMDIGLIQGKQHKCGDYNANQVIEKAAEVFAAEFIYPEPEFLALVEKSGIEKGKCRPEDVVHFKKACGAQVSYQFLCKRFTRLGFASPDEFKKIQFQKLEEKMFGVPIYKQSWFQARRRTRKSASSS